MEDPRWVRLITIGLVLAVLAVGYFLFTGRFISNNSSKSGSEISRVTGSPSPSPTAGSTVLGQNTQSSPSPVVFASPTPATAFNTLADRTQAQTPALPRTGAPVGVLIMLSISAIITGFGLRKFPK